MKKGNFYPVGEKTGLVISNLGYPANRFQVESTGEFRFPKKGEWFLSGAIIQGYKTQNDLTTSYNIGKLVEVKMETKITILQYLS